MSFLAFPRDRNGFNQETVECIRSSPMDSSVTYIVKTNKDVETMEILMLDIELYTCAPC